MGINIQWELVVAEKNVDLSGDFALPGEKDITPVGKY